MSTVIGASEPRITYSTRMLIEPFMPAPSKVGRPRKWRRTRASAGNGRLEDSSHGKLRSAAVLRHKSRARPPMNRFVSWDTITRLAKLTGAWMADKAPAFASGLRPRCRSCRPIPAAYGVAAAHTRPCCRRLGGFSLLVGQASLDPVAIEAQLVEQGRSGSAQVKHGEGSQ